jgi:MoaA/NifB/PqqE/SkfB family radical SAM enzyme
MGLLYSKLKIFNFKDKLDSLPAENNKILPPLHIRIKPTNICGHNCWYCAYRTDNLQLGKDMVKADYIPKEKMMEIVDDVIDMGVNAVTFSGGGDPFYYPYLLDAVKKLSHSPVKFASLTNGARLEGELAEIFAHSATWLRVSMDGWDDDSYADYRKVKSGEFTRVMKNMEKFKKLGGKCYLGTCLVVDKKNAEHIYDFVRRLKDIGVDSVKVSPCIVSNEGMENNNYHKSIFGLAKEQTKRAIDTLADTNFEIFDSYHELDSKFEKDYSWCPFLQILPVIGADLNVYSCHDKAYNLKDGLIGSIRDIRFKDFWFSDKNKFFKINPSVVCNHHCVVNANNKLILEYLSLEKEHLEFV